MSIEVMGILSAVAQELLNFLLPLLAASIASAVWVKAVEIWARMKAEQPAVTDILAQSAKIAVIAAEQAGAGKLSEEKKKYAIDFAEKWLKTRGITLDLDLIAASIEAAVYKEFNAPDAAFAPTAKG